jgi:hypothetical protein
MYILFIILISIGLFFGISSLIIKRMPRVFIIESIEWNDKLNRWEAILSKTTDRSRKYLAFVNDERAPVKQQWRLKEFNDQFVIDYCHWTAYDLTSEAWEKYPEEFYYYKEKAN